MCEIKRMALLTMVMLGLLVPVTVRAEQSDYSVAAGQYMQQLGLQAITTLRSKTIGASEKQRFMEQLFVANVDIPWVAKFVMGRHWKQVTPAQQQQYIAAYQSFVVKHYVSKFTEYTGQDIALTGARQDAQGNYLVTMTILSSTPGVPAITTGYRLRLMQDGRFKIFDVLVEGVSLITTQRTEFASVIAQMGVEYLIAQLERKTVEAARVYSRTAG